MAGTGDGPAAGGHRGPRQVDVLPGAGPLGALALGPLVFASLALGGQLVLVPLLGLLAEADEFGPGLGVLALELGPELAGGFLAALVLLAPGERGQALGFVPDGPGLGEVGAVVLPDLEHGPTVRGGGHVAVLVPVEEPGLDDQLDHAAAHPSALRVEPGPDGDEPVAGAVPPDPAVVVAAGRRDEGIHPARPPGPLADLAGVFGGDEPADLGFVVVGVEAGGVVGVVAVGVVVADLGGAPGVAVAAGQAPHLPAFAPVAAGADADGARVAQAPVQGGAASGYPGGAGGGHWCLPGGGACGHEGWLWLCDGALNVCPDYAPLSEHSPLPLSIR